MNRELLFEAYSKASSAVMADQLEAEHAGKIGPLNNNLAFGIIFSQDDFSISIRRKTRHNFNSAITPDYLIPKEQSDAMPEDLSHFTWVMMTSTKGDKFELTFGTKEDFPYEENYRQVGDYTTVPHIPYSETIADRMQGDAMLNKMRSCPQVKLKKNSRP